MICKSIISKSSNNHRLISTILLYFMIAYLTYPIENRIANWYLRYKGKQLCLKRLLERGFISQAITCASVEI